MQRCPPRIAEFRSIAEDRPHMNSIPLRRHKGNHRIETARIAGGPLRATKKGGHRLRCAVLGAALWAALLSTHEHAAAETSPPSPTATIVLRVPCFSDHREKFYLELLQASLDAVHQAARLECVDNLPGRRMWKLVGEGRLDVIWGLQSADKDRRMVPIKVGLTDGLAGQRVLLIRPQDQKLFDQVSSVETLRETHLVAGFGEGWFDVFVWNTNGLRVYEIAEQFPLIYSMVAIGNRGVDYLPRGAQEIAAEAKAHEALAIEQHLLFIYNNDMRFYLSKPAARHKDIIAFALASAESTGLKRRLIQKFFAADLSTLGLAQRKRIRLHSPPLDQDN